MDAAQEAEGLQTEQNLERRLRELESIVGRLEESNCPITEAIKKYSEGMALALECRRDLNKLTQQIAHAREEALQAFKQLEQGDAQNEMQWRNQQNQSTPSNNQDAQGHRLSGSSNVSNQPQAAFNEVTPDIPFNDVPF